MIEEYEKYTFVNEYFISPINVQFLEIKCNVCNLSYEDDKYKRDIDKGFPLYFHKENNSYIQFCSCKCGLKYKENINV